MLAWAVTGWMVVAAAIVVAAIRSSFGRNSSPPPSRDVFSATLRWASFACSHERRIVDPAFASWNQILVWLSHVDAFRQAPSNADSGARLRGCDAWSGQC